MQSLLVKSITISSWDCIYVVLVDVISPILHKTFQPEYTIYTVIWIKYHHCLNLTYSFPSSYGYDNSQCFGHVQIYDIKIYALRRT